MIWWLWLAAGPPGLGLAAGVYRGGGLNWEPALVGLLLSLACALFELARGFWSPGSGPRLLGATLLGYLAWLLLKLLLEHFSGLTWMLLAPFHHAALLVICVILAALVLPGRADWSFYKPPVLPGRLGWLLLVAGVALLAGLAVGLKAVTLGQAADTAAGLKGIIKNPALLLVLLGLGGAGLGLLARWRPLWLLRLAMALGFGLIWAGMGLDMVSAMAPLMERLGSEIIQLLFLSAACGLGLRLAMEPGAPVSSSRVS